MIEKRKKQPNNTLIYQQNKTGITDRLPVVELHCIKVQVFVNAWFEICCSVSNIQQNVELLSGSASSFKSLPEAIF